MFYLEACESGSIFGGLLPENLDIYATTASNATEDSFATYCPDEPEAPKVEYNTCLGDLYSVSWLEDRHAIFCIIITIMYCNNLPENIFLNQLMCY